MTDVDRRPTAGETPAPTRTRGWPLSPTRLACCFAVLYLPFIGLGYGTDIDITNLLRSGESILDGDYRYSRPPGSFPYELTVGVLDRIGGSIMVNLGSVAMAVVVLVSLGRILEWNHGERAARIAIVVVGSQPWFWVAATSLGDYLFALGLLLVGIDAAQRDARIVAGLAFGLAIGFRSVTAALVLAYLLAEVTGPVRGRPDEAPALRWRAAVQTGLLTAATAVLMFIPPWLSVGRTAQFLENQLRAGDFAVMVARWGVKNVAFFGVVTLAVLAIRAPVLWAGLRRFGDLVMVRFVVFGALATEAVYLRFPWKPVHLLPMIVLVAVLLAVSPRTSNRLVAAVVASQLVLAVVSVSIAEPDVADAATDGRFAPGITRGVVVNDIACRVDTPFEGEWPDLDTVEADLAAVGRFACQAKTWRAGEGPSPLD